MGRRHPEGELAALASTGRRRSRLEVLFTAGAMVGAVNSILGGVGIDSAGTVLVGGVAAVVVFGWHMVWERRRALAALGLRAAASRHHGRPQ